MSWCFACSVCWVPKVSLADQVSTAACTGPDPSEIRRQIQELIADEQLVEALACSDLAVIKHPHDRDLPFQNIRLLAWTKNHQEAAKRFERWPIDDPESALLSGDLGWYQGDCANAIAGYEKSQVLLGTKPLPDPQSRALTVCRKRTFGEQSNRKSKKAKDYQKANELLVQFTRFDQSQNQGIESSLVEFVSKIAKTANLRLPAERLKRDFGRFELYDTIWQSQLDWRYHELTATRLTIGYSPDPEFSFNSLVEGEQFLFWGGWIFSRGIRQSRFDTSSFELYFTSLTREVGPWWLQTKGFAGEAGEYYTKSGLFRLRYMQPAWFGELWTAFGSGEASRPYLTQQNSSFFRSLGIKLSLQNSRVSPYIAVEKRWEAQFSQTMALGGLTWAF